MKKMIAALYIRVSTEDQIEGFSIPAQINQLKEYCQRNNIEVYRAYVDEGISGQKENRPEFQKMIQDAGKKLFDIILVHKFDRFARKVELSQRIKRELRKSGVNVISMSEPIEDSPIGFFQEGILELLAEYYVRNLATETKKGHVERASQGLDNGSIPFGYKRGPDGVMIIDPPAAEIVKYIFELYTNQGLGSTKIAMILNDMGVKTAVNGLWAHFTVSRILKNVKYIGKIYYDSEIYDGKHEPIIDKETFEIAAGERKDRMWPAAHRGANFEKFWALGLLRCGQCKKVMSIIFSKKQKRKFSRHYLKCNNARHYGTVIECTHVKNYAALHLQDDIIEILEDYMVHWKADIEVVKKIDIENIIEAQRDKATNELKRAEAAYLAGAFTLEKYMEHKTRIEKELAELDKPKEETTNVTKIQNKIKNVLDEFNAAETPTLKRNVLKKLIEVIYVNEGRLHFVLKED